MNRASGAGLALFRPGAIISTRGFIRAIEELEGGVQQASFAMRRHLTGDWGDLSNDDIAENFRALQVGNRILSAYHLSNGEKFWIITEADRSVTTYLLPEEY